MIYPLEGIDKLSFKEAALEPNDEEFEVIFVYLQVAGNLEELREKCSCGLVPKVITARAATVVASARESVREELAFLYSTPAYRIALDVLGFTEVGERLTAMACSGDWTGLAGVLTDPVLDALVTQCVYAELPAVLTAQYANLCDGIALAVPQDAADDEEFRRMCDELRSVR